MPHRNRVIVIDDKAEDGEAIVRCLWKLQIPSFFLFYDGENVDELDINKGFEGIRFIFQDIDLIAKGGLPGTGDYSAAATAINRLLKEENGPWLLIAWSTWGNDPENGEKYAQELFDYLVERLPVGKRPYQFVVIEKGPYLANGIHGTVKADLSDSERTGLIESVKSVVNPVASLEALGHWEADVRNSASRVIHNLWDMIDSGSPEELDKSLGGVLFQLAVAQEGGRVQKTDDLSTPLYQILSSLLYDKISHVKAQEIKVSKDVKPSVQANLVNTMLHWESATDGARYSPGIVYSWPMDKEPDLGGLCIAKSNLNEFIIDAFVSDDQNKRRDANADVDLLKQVELVLLDITPACDYANDKAFWRRFLVGIKVLGQAKKHFYTGKTKLAGESLKETPVFSNNGDDFQFIFSSRMVISLSDKNEYLSERSEPDQANGNVYTPDVTKLNSIGRIREQLLQEFIAWFGGMATRPGIVSLR